MRGLVGRYRACCAEAGVATDEAMLKPIEAELGRLQKGVGG